MCEEEVVGRMGSRKGLREVTREDREAFEERGRECWREMEGLRVAWAERVSQEWTAHCAS